MTIKLYLDEDVDPLLAGVLLDRGIDCLSAVLLFPIIFLFVNYSGELLHF